MYWPLMPKGAVRLAQGELSLSNTEYPHSWRLYKVPTQGSEYTRILLLGCVIFQLDDPTTNREYGRPRLWRAALKSALRYGGKAPLTAQEEKLLAREFVKWVKSLARRRFPNAQA